MENKCPYCDKDIDLGSVVCRHCGSPIVEWTPQRRVWPRYAALGGLLALVIAVILVVTLVDPRPTPQPPPPPKPVDPAVLKLQAQQAEKQKKEVEEVQRLQALKVQREADRKAREQEDQAWLNMSPDQRSALVDSKVKEIRSILDSLRSRAAGDPELAAAIPGLEASLASLNSVVETKDWQRARNQAVSLLQKLKELDSKKAPVQSNQ